MLEKICFRCKATLPVESFHRARDRRDGRYPNCKACVGAEVKIRQATPAAKAAKKDYDRVRVAGLREELSAQGRARYLANRPAALASAKAWALQNPDKRRAITQSYKHRRRSVERAGMTGGALAIWKTAQRKICHWCALAVPTGFVVDHINPLSKGGAHEAHNLAISCRPCNARKAARDPIEWAQSRGNLI